MVDNTKRELIKTILSESPCDDTSRSILTIISYTNAHNVFLSTRWLSTREYFSIFFFFLVAAKTYSSKLLAFEILLFDSPFLQTHTPMNPSNKTRGGIVRGIRSISYPHRLIRIKQLSSVARRITSYANRYSQYRWQRAYSYVCMHEYVPRIFNDRLITIRARILRAFRLDFIAITGQDRATRRPAQRESNGKQTTRYISARNTVCRINAIRHDSPAYRE